MKINNMSDLHLEFGPLDNMPSGDVLVLAGDITVRNEHLWWIEELDFKHILYTPGNHEFYDAEMNHILRRIKEYFADSDKVHVLDDDIVEIDGQRFLGGTMWTDFNGGEWTAMETARQQMNDFNIIWLAERDAPEKIFHPVNAKSRFHATVQFLKDNLRPGDAVVTHMAPSFQSNHPRYKDSLLNYAYASDLEWLMREKKPAVWFHGHVHDSFNYVVHETRVLCNPRGYYRREENPEFDINACVTI